MLLASLLVAGCASWTNRSNDETEKAKLPALKQNSRAVVLKFDFVPIDRDTTDPDQIQSLWQWVDEVIIDASTRHDWRINGLRAGRVINVEQFRRKLDSIKADPNAVEQFLAQADVASEVSQGGKRIPMRLGRRYELPIRRPIAGSHVTLVRLGEQTVGETLQDPQFLFAVTPRPAATAMQVELNLRPEIQHGAMRQDWIPSDTTAALRIDRRRESWSLKELDLLLSVSEGDLFVIAGTAEPTGLGQQMLCGNRADNMQQQVVMLIEVAQIPKPTSSL